MRSNVTARLGSGLALVVAAARACAGSKVTSPRMTESSAPRPSAFISSLLRFLLLQPNLGLLCCAQIASFWYFTHAKIVVLHSHGLLRGVLGALSVMALLGLVNLALAWLPGRFLRVLGNSLFIFAYVLLILYHWKRGAPLDFVLLATNWRELLTPSGIRAVIDVGGRTLIVVMALLVEGLFLLEYWPRGLSRVRPCPRPRIVGPVLALLILPCLGPWRIPNEVTLFLRSAKRFVHDPALAAIAQADSPQRFPLFRAPAQAHPAVFLPEQRPNVFIVFMESFSSDFVQKRELDYAEITPYFNSLIVKGAYHELFFSNSMQTERGLTATLCSMIPSFRHKVMTTNMNNHLLCLPEVLRGAGYATLWAQGHPDLKFDNVGNFMRKIGFEERIAMNDKFLTKEDAEFKWGWGLQDDRFFKKVFAFIDAEHRDPARPLFCALATITNHMNFDRMPEKLRGIYPQPSKLRQHFVNSIHLADSYLEAFFEELHSREYLHNSLVILLGDHGYPTGQHGFTSNEISFYDENFHVPLLVLGAGVEPFVNDTIAYSQLDLMPSLLEWLGITRPVAVNGVPIAFRAADLPSSQHWIPLIQPYDGGYLASLSYPYKYVRSFDTEDEWLFDLAKDPREETNLLPQWGERREPLPTLRRDLTGIYLSQRLLDEDRFVPGDGTL